ncbi:MAG TPA: hypothetical protein VGV38_09975 [Pyrinomonadaceae bacterium]|nr:hypothetical protein [Pyrinomonadaceae bacterium]
MSLAVKICLAASGVYLLMGMLIGVVKYRKTMTSAEHRSPVYIDIAHRAAFMYSFAALVMARLLESSPYAERVQLGAAGLVLLFLTLTIFGYLSHGLHNDTDNIFRERNFSTTWYMYLLIAGEIGGFAVILWGFLTRQFGV